MNKYLANTAISISVTLPNGNSTRVSFSPLSNGTSVFYTSDKDIQWALEHHYKFGKLFRLVDETPKVKTPVPQKSDIESASENDKDDGDAAEYTEVTVSDVDAAKDYLAEHFEVVRTKLKTEDTITKTALSFGIVFKYL